MTAPAERAQSPTDLAPDARPPEVGAVLDGLLEQALRAARAPGDAQQWAVAVVITDHLRCAPEFGSQPLHQLGPPQRLIEPPEPAQVVLAETAVDNPPHPLRQLGVVAELGMAVERQVIGV